MTIGFPRIASGPSLLDEDDVLPVLGRWRQQGLRTVLVTLTGVEGGAPRQPGAQMAVAEDGRYCGYLSGGCLEQAVALEAVDAMRSGGNRLVRYGKGSPYFDIKLPCGSGLDLYFDQGLRDGELTALLEHRGRRQSCVLRTVLGSGDSSVEIVDGAIPVSHCAGDVFVRAYPAAMRLALIGNGPALTGIAALAQAAGLDLVVWSTDDVTRGQLRASGVQSGSSEAELEAAIAGLDDASAAVVVFHDHEAEPGILRRLLARPCFYLGVLGNHAVHRARIDALRQLGVTTEALERLHAPVGSIANAKSKTTFAFGVLAEMLAEAKARNLIA